MVNEMLRDELDEFPHAWSLLPTGCWISSRGVVGICGG
jgi:hypothetical protein